MDTPLAPLLNFIVPQLLSLGPIEAATTQFAGSRNLFDRIQDAREAAGGTTVDMYMRQADARNIERISSGIERTFTGEANLSKASQLRHQQIGQLMAENLSYAINEIGEDPIDALSGSRGSSLVMGRRVRRALQTARDPFTKEIGYSADRAGQLAANMFDQLYGNADTARTMQGISAGQVGTLVQELQARGMLGRSLNSLPIEEQRNMLSSTLADRDFKRIVENSGEVRMARVAGREATAEERQRTEDAVRGVYAKLQDKSQPFEAGEISDNILQNLESKRIADKIRGMSKSLKTMQDIFGDAGRPNAPMQELISGLEKLTQGASASMSDAQVNKLLRETQAVANQTGAGIDAVSAMQQSLGNLSEQMGGHRILGAQAAITAFTGVQALADAGEFETPVWGADDKLKATERAGRLAVQGANSSLANQLGALARLQEEAGITVKAGSELEAMRDAINAGKHEYTYQGQVRKVNRTENEFKLLVSRDSDASANLLRQMLDDRTGNQEYYVKNDYDPLLKLAQGDDQRKKIANELQASISADLAAPMKLLQDAGTLKDGASVGRFTQDISSRLVATAIDMRADQFQNEDTRTELLTQSVQRGIRDALRRNSPNASEEDIEAQAQRMGITPEVARQIAAGAYANMRTNSIFNVRASNKETQMLEAERRRENKIIRLKQDSMAGFGNAPILTRLADFVIGNKGDSDAADLLKTVIGTPDAQALDNMDPEGLLASWLKVERDKSKYDLKTPEGEKKYEQAAILQAAILGTQEMAAKALKDLDKAGAELSPHARNLLERKSQGEDLDAQKEAEKLGLIVDAKVSSSKVKDASKLVTDILEALPGKDMAAATREGKRQFLTANRELGRDMLADTEGTMKALGAGGLDLVKSVLATSDEIEKIIANANANRDGNAKEMTFDDFNRKDSNMPEDVQNAVRAQLAKNAEVMKTISERRSTEAVAGSTRNSTAERSKEERVATEQENLRVAKEAREKLEAANAPKTSPIDNSRISPQGLKDSAKPTDGGAPAPTPAEQMKKENASLTTAEKPPTSGTDGHLAIGGTLTLKMDGTAILDGFRAAQKSFAAGGVV